MIIVPGVVGPAVQLVHGCRTKGEFRGVGAPDDDGAGLLQAPDHRGIVRGNQILESRHTIAVGGALLINIDLDGDRDTVQRADRAVLLQDFVVGCSLFQRRVRLIDDDGVQMTVLGPDPVDDRAYGIRGADTRIPDGSGQLHGAPLP